MPFGLQPLHLVIIAIVALLIFGPERLPEIGRGLGRAINEFRRGTQEMAEGFREEAARTPGPTSLPAAPSAPQPDSQVSCPQCGAINTAEARFCTRCGTQLPSVENDS